MTSMPISRRHMVQGSAFGTLAMLTTHTALGQSPRVLRMRVYADLQSADPATTKSADTDGVIDDAIYSRLISYEPGDTWAWKLDAAEALEPIDDTHIAFRLRKGIQWTNGYGELTADDVKFSFERVIDPALGSTISGDWVSLDHVEVTDRYAGVIVLKEPFAPLFTTTLPYYAGCIVCKRAVEEHGVYTTQVPASSGPYYLKEWTPLQKIVLARNPGYYGASPAFDEIHLIPITDDKAAENAFAAGELDYAPISVSSIPVYKENPPNGATLTVKPSETYYWIGMNVEHPKFKDPRVRAAVQNAIDVDEIIEAAFFGVTPRATGIIAPGMVGHRDANTVGKPDLEKARQLLAEAGVPSGFDCTLSVLNQTDRLTACQVIQSQLKQIGINVEIVSYEPGIYWNLGFEGEFDYWKDLQISFLRYTSAPDPYWATQWFTCEQVGQWNWERWCSEEYTQLDAEAHRTLDPVKRDQLYKRMMDLMEASGAYIFVTYEATASLTAAAVKAAVWPNNRAVLRAFEPI